MKVLIHIPCLNQIEYLRQCLDSIRTTAPAYMDVIVDVLDNGSTEPIEQAIPAGILHGRFDYRKGENTGLSKSWNTGIDKGLAESADVIAIVNSDVVFGPKVIENCVRAVTEYDFYASFPLTKQGGPIEEDFQQKAREYAEKPLAENLIVTGGFAGWCHFLSRECIEKVGKYDENFRLWHGDSDYHWRLAGIGKRPVEVRACYLHHWESATIRSTPGGFNCFGWREQDAKLFAAKYPPAKA